MILNFHIFSIIGILKGNLPPTFVEGFAANLIIYSGGVAIGKIMS